MLDHPKLLTDYETCFQQSIGGLIATGRESFVGRYVGLLQPQIQIASSQGFRPEWEFTSNNGADSFSIN
jgi:hypothetical protein